jgi:hypothetical protein
MKKLFKCPISPYIMWERGLTYTECPMSIHGRDMPQCADCHLKGRATIKPYKEKIEKEIKVERKINKGPIPKIGKTYST